MKFFAISRANGTYHSRRTFADQVLTFRVHYQIGLLAISVTVPSSRRAQSLLVARQRPSVREWRVSSEQALHRPQGTEASEQAQSGRLREIESAERGGELVADPPSTDEASATSLRFDEVFRRYAPYVGALVLKLIGRPGDVDDVVQDVFIQAHRGLSSLREPAAVRPWLRRITVRRSRRWLRKRWVLRWFRESDVDTENELVDPSASPEERTQITYIYRALERMPRDERLAWVLRFVEGETLEAIAELLGCSVSTVQRRLRAAQASMGEVR
jgi:RNA polymerase sigma-70 factor, ECF subfamily